MNISAKIPPIVRELKEKDEEKHNEYDQDDQRTLDEQKRTAREKVFKWLSILCIWECTWAWIRVSDVLRFIIFDAFTELFIAVCTVINIVCMALNDYRIECDNNNWEDGGYLDGM